jgi:perosamine synthetase
MNIPFHKPYITDEEIEEVVDSIRSGWLTMGPKTQKFEEEFKKYIGCAFAIAVNSCTAALHLSLKIIGIKEGDEVIIPTMTFTATGEVVTYFGAKPVLVDVDKETHNISVEAIEKAITPRTKAIIPVHYGGQPCDMDEIMEIAKKYNLYVIEDAAHALPASYKDKRVGTIGDITCFSFYATKTLATGEGGMITTENGEWADRMRILRLHGISRDAWKRYTKEGSWYYEVIEAGYKYNMTDIQAALGIAQLKKLEWMQQKRAQIADRYNLSFKDSELINLLSNKFDRTSAWHLYVIRLNIEALRIDRAGFIEALKEQGIGTSVHFIPLHRHPFYRNKFGYNPKSFPMAEWIYERSISLPIYPGMTEKEVDFVIENVLSLINKYKR